MNAPCSTISLPTLSLQIIPQSALCIRKTADKGRGLFAQVGLDQWTLLDQSPVILIPRKEVQGVLLEYTFRWSSTHDALALGLGSLFNHDREPNCAYSLDRDNQVIVFKTRRRIEVGEELLISYGREESLWWKSSEESGAGRRDESDDLDLDPLARVTL